MDVYLEVGKKRTFAGAVDWPGWCRSARDEEAALQALCYYGPRYALAMQNEGIAFKAVCRGGDFHIVERLEGNGTTDFGAPGAPPAADQRALDALELAHYEAVLRACWAALEDAAAAAAGKDLRLGPRGGGRSLEKIVEHVYEAHRAYVRRIGWKVSNPKLAETRDMLEQSRREALDALEAAAQNGARAGGPRGGANWTPRYFIRRSAWHVLDHAWEIEDRIIDA